jgi:hypothetical protein
VPNWRILIYTRSRNVDYMNEQLTCSLNMQRRFFDELQLYNECFVVGSKQKCEFKRAVQHQLWFDGLSRWIPLRSCSISKAVAFAMAKTNMGDKRAMEMFFSVFLPISVQQPGYWERFVRVTEADQVVSVISLVKPWERSKFACHLCMSLGH